jgi:hypothetical protein
LFGGVTMTNLAIGMNLKSTKTSNTYIVESINLSNNRVYLKDINSNEVAEQHILSKVIESVESGYYTIIEEVKAVDNYKVIDEFLQAWKDSATAYYNNLLKEYMELYTLKKSKKEWATSKNKSDLAVIAKVTCYGIYDTEKVNQLLDEMLTKDVKSKKISLVSKVEKKAGKIIDATKLYVANDGNINGYITGEIKTVEVETILAGGHNVQCMHYRVLVK